MKVFGRQEERELSLLLLLKLFPEQELGLGPGTRHGLLRVGRIQHFRAKAPPEVPWEVNFPAELQQQDIRVQIRYHSL